MENMPNESIDPETMAAFLDGTLSAEERARVLERIATSSDLYEEFLDASAIAADVNATEAPGPAPAKAPAPIVGPSARQRSRWLVFGPLLLAAGLAAALITPRVVHQSNIADADPIERLASTLTGSTGAASFGAGWNTPAWSATRGAAEELSASARSFRDGVQFVDLVVARQIGDEQAAARSAGAIGQLLISTGGGGAVAAIVRQFSRPEQKTTTRTQTESALRQAESAPDWFDLGTWCETARLAAKGNHLDRFVAGGDVFRGLREIMRGIDTAPAPEREGLASSLDALKDVSRNGFPKNEDAEEIARRLDSVIVALAR
jgi:hypothetical protein